MSLKDLVLGVTRLGCSTTARLLMRARVWGLDNVPASGPLIVASNHQSYFDPVLVGSFAPRTMHFMARDSLFGQPGLGWVIRYLNAFPVRREGADVASFKQALRLLHSGEAVVLFPEGTRTRSGRVGPMHPGIIGLARRSEAPILPVAIEGAFDAWPRHARLPRPAALWMEYAAPITVAELGGSDARAAADNLTDAMRRLHNRLRERAGRIPLVYHSGGQD